MPQVPIEQYFEKLRKSDPKYHWPFEREKEGQPKRQKIHKKFPYVITYSGNYGPGWLLDDMQDWCRDQFGNSDEISYEFCDDGVAKPLSEDVRVVCLGAGAAGIASMKLLQGLGADPEKLFMIDRNGIIQDERNDLNKYKKAFAVHTDKRTLADAMDGADVFIGVSGPDLLSPDMLATMAPHPVVFALSNPDPEILPELAHMTRDDLIMGTGRSDYPNQVNNVLGFPYIFKGALDVRASCINQEMQIAAVHALAELAREPVPHEVLDAYGLDTMVFGPDYIIPKPFDPRLIDTVPRAVSKAAIATGVAKKFPRESRPAKEA